MLPALLKAGSALAKGGAPKNKINPKKFAALAEQKKADAKPKGGALVPMADIKTTIVTIKPEQDKKVEGAGKDPLIRELESINTRLTDLRTALINRKKVQLDVIKGKKKLAQKQKRAAKEEENEAKKPKNTSGFLKLGPKLPSLGIFDAIFKILGILFLGWLTRFLPQILDGVKAFIQTVEKIVEFAKPIIKPILDGLMWFTKKSVEFTAGLLGVQNTEENSIIKNFTEIIKKIPLIEAAFAAIAVGNAASILGGDRDKPDSGRDRRRTRAENRQRQRQRTRQASKAARQRYQRRFGGDAARRRFQGQVRTKPGFVKRLGFKVPKSALNMFKGVSKAAKGIKIPIIGPLIVGITEFLSSGNLGKALFLSLGTALGELLGTAIPIPVVGTLLGGVIGMFVGDLLYELILGGGPEAALKKLKDAGMAILSAGKAAAEWLAGGFQRSINGLFEKDPVEIQKGGGRRSVATKVAELLGIKGFLKDRGYLDSEGNVAKFPNLLNLLNPFAMFDVLKNGFFPPGEPEREPDLGAYQQPADTEEDGEDISGRIATPDNVEQPSTASSSVAPAAAPAASMASSASSISQSASYDKPQGPSAVPFPIGQAQGMGASGPGGSSSSAGGGVNRYKIINDLKKSILLAQMYKG
jgi:hypothetical protein